MNSPDHPDQPDKNTQRPRASNSASNRAARQPPSEEPGFFPKEDIPLDGPDPVGQKMIDELQPGAEPAPRQDTGH